MKLRDNKIFLGLFGAMIFFFGCKKFVAIDAPITQLVSTSVFKNNAAATAAQTVIYSQMNSESFFMSVSCGLLSDEMQNLSSGTNNYNEFYTNSLNATDNFGPWNNAYNYIYQANAILEGLQKNTGVIPVVRQQLMGESKFIRAFWYFYLINLYGDLPLVTGTDYTINSVLGRTVSSDIYKQIIADLKDAGDLLNVNYVDATDTATSSERTRPNKSAAAALLARVYLFNHDYANAADQATSVIINNQYSLCTDLNNVFIANSTEAIWQLAIPLPSDYSTADGSGFIIASGPGGSTASVAIAINTPLLNSFEHGDLRRDNWIGSYTTTDAPIDTYYYPNKYKNKFASSSSITEYTMVLRLAEQLLIRAEARIQNNGDIAGALEDLNKIRRRAGLLDYAGIMDKSSVLAAILHERQTELFTEWGHRWFDLIRTDNINMVMGAPENVCEAKGGTWDPNWTLFPIPQTERNNDFNLTQNPGY